MGMQDLFFGFHVPEIAFLPEMLIFLLSGVLIVPLFQKMRASPVLGYLFVGLVVGPYGLGLIEHTPVIETLASLGVVFLLFMIGLELSLDRLIAMRRYVFLFGFSQILVTSVIVGAIAYLWGNSVEISILLGGCFALSSTAIVSQLLIENNELMSRMGRVTLSVLLAQDLAVVPLLVLVKVFGQEASAAPYLALSVAVLKGVLAILIIFVFGRYCLRPLFNFVDRAKQSPELFMAMTLLTVLLTAYVTEAAGLSMELGAFLAGLLLAETEFHNRVSTDLKPFEGLLLGLFFITVGMKIDVSAIMDSLGWVLASVIGLLVIKSAVVAFLGYLFRLGKSVSVPTGLMLGQGGEFVYVVMGAALASGIIASDVASFMLLVTAVSMALAPFTAAAAIRLKQAWLPQSEED